MLLTTGIITLLLFVTFISFYLSDPRRVINGFWFNLFFCSFLIFCCILGYSTGSKLLMIFALFPFAILLFMQHLVFLL